MTIENDFRNKPEQKELFQKLETALLYLSTGRIKNLRFII